MVSVEEGKRAAEAHDRFNLVAITPLALLTVASFATGSRQVDVLLTNATLAYICIDTVYNLAMPACQPSAFRLASITVHHLFTFWLTLHPVLHHENSDMTALCTVVEINTLILTVNRQLKWKSLTVAFYATWVAMRLVWYPYLIHVLNTRIRTWGAAWGDYYHVQVVASVIVLCALNVMWTVEVVAGMMKKKKAKPAAKTH